MCTRFWLFVVDILAWGVSASAEAAAAVPGGPRWPRVGPMDVPDRSGGRGADAPSPRAPGDTNVNNKCQQQFEIGMLTFVVDMR